MRKIYTIILISLFVLLASSRGLVFQYHGSALFDIIHVYAEGDGGGDGGDGGGGDGGGGDGVPLPPIVMCVGDTPTITFNYDFTGRGGYKVSININDVFAPIADGLPVPSGSFVWNGAANSTFYNYTVRDWSCSAMEFGCVPDGGLAHSYTGSFTTPNCAPPPPPSCSASPNPVDINQSITVTASGGNGAYVFGAAPAGCTVTSATANSVTGSCSTSGDKIITVTSAGQTGQCSLSVNATPLPATIRVNKIVTNDDGGTKVIANFPLFVNTTSVTSVAVNTFSPGTYTVSETNQPGYVATFSGDCNASGQVTIAAAQNKICTLTNNDTAPVTQPATIRVNKIVTNDDGGTKVIANFPLFVNTTSVTSGAVNTFSPGTYTVSETNQPGYVATFSGDCSANGQVTIAAGQNKICTLTNNDTAPVAQPATIRVNKVVINDNTGTKVIANFPLFVNTTSVTSGAVNTFSPGTYTVSETNQPGYVATFSGDCNANGQVTIAAGQNKICTLTNNDTAPVAICPLPQI